MRQQLAAILCAVLIAFPLGTVWSQDRSSDTNVNTIRFDVFVRSDRDSAEPVQAYADELRNRITGLDVRVYDVLKDEAALVRLYALSKKAGREKPLLPAFHSCDRMYFGFVDADQTGPHLEELFTANLYTRSTCPRCQALKTFLPTLQRRWPAIRFVNHDVDRSPSARSAWQTLCQRAGTPPGLPTIDFARRILIGYQGDDVTGAQLDRLIEQVSGIEPPEPLGNHTTRGKRIRVADAPSIRLNAYATLLPTSLLVAQVAQAAPEPAAVEDIDESPIDLLALPDEAEASEIGEEETIVETVASDTIDVPLVGRLRASEVGMPLFTLIVGLVDGFNPCAMWVLVFLLSVLVNIKDRRKILLIAGTFVLVSGLAYFAFMAAWLNVFMLIGIVRPVQIALGLLAILIGVVNVKDFFAFKKGVSLSIPESQKPLLYRRVREIVSAKYLTAALSGAVVLAVIVNMIEMLCTAGLPALYTQVLTMQEYPAWKNYGFLTLYIVAYMFDDTVLVAIVVTTLSHRKLQEREGRWLKLVSGLVILLLGLVMLLRPEWLTLGS